MMKTTKINGKEVLELFGDKTAPGYDAKALYQELLDNAFPGTWKVVENDNLPTLNYIPRSGYYGDNKFAIVVGAQFFTEAGNFSKKIDCQAYVITERDACPGKMDGKFREVYFEESFNRMAGYLSRHFLENGVFCFEKDLRSKINKNRSIARMFIGNGARAFEVVKNA